MRLSAHAKLSIAFALSLTLGVKAAWTRETPLPDTQLFNQRAHQLLRAQGFTTRPLQQRFGILVAGRKGNCRLVVGDYPPQGFFAEPIAHLARPIGELRFLWDGEISRTAPKIAPLMDFYARRELRRLGLPADRRPVVAIAASRACRPESLDWRPLLTLPR